MNSCFDWKFAYSPIYLTVALTSFSYCFVACTLFYSTSAQIDWKELSLYSLKYSPNLKL